MGPRLPVYFIFSSCISTAKPTRHHGDHFWFCPPLSWISTLNSWSASSVGKFALRSEHTHKTHAVGEKTNCYLQAFSYGAYLYENLKEANLYAHNIRWIFSVKTTSEASCAVKAVLRHIFVTLRSCHIKILVEGERDRVHVKYIISYLIIIVNHAQPRKVLLFISFSVKFLLSKRWHKKKKVQTFAEHNNLCVNNGKER